MRKISTEFNYPDFNGQFTGELVRKQMSRDKKRLICFFDLHDIGENFKLSLARKILSKSVFCPKESNINFNDVPLHTNWKCTFKNGKWLTAQPIKIIEREEN